MPIRFQSRKPRRRYGERKPFGRAAAEGREGGVGERPGRFFRKKVCRFCGERVAFIDFKETEKLVRFLTEKGKIVPRRITGNCAKHQRMLARALKRARHSALLAFQIE